MNSGKTSPVINENLNLVVDENNNIINSAKLVAYIQSLEYDFDDKEQLESLFQNISNNNYGNKDELEKVLKEKLDEFERVDTDALDNQALLSSLQSENEDLVRLRYIETPRIDNDSRNYADYIEIIKKDGTAERVEVKDPKGFADFINEHRGEISSWTAEDIFEHFKGAVYKSVEMQDEKKLLTEQGMAAKRDEMDRHAEYKDPAIIAAERNMIVKYACDTNHDDISKISESVDSRGERVWSTNGTDFVKFIDTPEGRQLVSLSDGKVDEVKKDENGNVLPNENQNGMGDNASYHIIPGYLVSTNIKSYDTVGRFDDHHEIPVPKEEGMPMDPNIDAGPGGSDNGAGVSSVVDDPKLKKLDVEEALMGAMPGGVKFGMAMVDDGKGPKESPNAPQTQQPRKNPNAPQISGTMNMEEFDALLEQRELQGPDFPMDAEQSLDNYAYIAAVMLNQKIEKAELDPELETLFDALSAYVQPLVSEFDDNMVYGAQMNIPEVQSIILQEWPRLSDEAQKLLQTYYKMPENKQKVYTLTDPEHHGAANMSVLITFAIIGIIIVAILALAIR